MFSFLRNKYINVFAPVHSSGQTMPPIKLPLFQTHCDTYTHFVSPKLTKIYSPPVLHQHNLIFKNFTDRSKMRFFRLVSRNFNDRNKLVVAFMLLCKKLRSLPSANLTRTSISPTPPPKRQLFPYNIVIRLTDVIENGGAGTLSICDWFGVLWAVFFK